jgi:glucose-6-phosphate dehydrogenase assembly protein OpcA
MAETYKVLGQAAPAATTATALYTVPSATSAIVSTITIANRSQLNDAFRIAVRVNGATLANQHYIAYDVAVAAADTTTLTLGLTLSAGDIVEVYANSANLSFNAFGTEIS